jgi:hypothetical protein
VIAESLFCRVADGAYAAQVPASRLHCRERQRSAKNLHRRVAALTQAGLFVWYSSGSAGNRRASMLVYSVQEDAVAAWYAGFIARPGWQVAQVKGIGREVVVSLAAGERTVEPASQGTTL